MFVIQRNSKIRFTFPRVKLDLGISIFFYNPDNGKDFVSTKIGAYIWLLMEKPISFNELLQNITQIDDSIDKEEIKKDIRKICNQFVKQNLAEYVEYYGG